MVKTIDAKMLSKMFLAGAKNLEEKKEWINELNVFPVPDGDTGTNMTLTIMAAAKEVSAMEKPDMDLYAPGNAHVHNAPLYRTCAMQPHHLDGLSHLSLF